RPGAAIRRGRLGPGPVGMCVRGRTGRADRRARPLVRSFPAMLTAAVLGLGMIGRHHARLLQGMAGVRFAGAVDPGGDRFGAVHDRSFVHGAIDELLAEGVPDPAVVAVPPDEPLAVVPPPAAAALAPL